MSDNATDVDPLLDISLPSGGSADTAQNLEIAIRLKKIREVFGFSQRELAKRAGVTNSSISMIEQGLVSPSIQSLSRILSVFPISLADFFSIKLSVDRLLSADEAVAEPTNCHTVQHRSEQLEANVECLGVKQFTAFEMSAVDTCGIVIDGALVLTLLDGNQLLGQGAHFYIPACQPFRFINLSEREASFFRCSLFTQKR